MTQSSDPGRTTAMRSSTSVTVDNVIRRSLRVADPTDASQLAKALLTRYEGDAEALRRERAGTPIQVRTVLPAVLPTGGGAMRAELAEAQNDLDRDLDALIGESQLKDIEAELRGWATAIRTASRNGLASARLALGPNERDRALAARHTLTDYARLSRYLAALTTYEPGLFCRLAQSLDIMGGLILVTAGEALAAGGVTSTSVILQSPSSELQTRREAVLAALRNLLGAAQESYGANEFHRGLTALRQLYRALEDNGATELRVYLDEGFLGNVFDEMIALASGRSAHGMRALGATSIVTTAQLERFIRICSDIAEPESPQLSNFLTTIQFFIEAFGAARSGYRLTHVARPPILHYGLYGAGGPDDPTRRLLRLIDYRGQFAQALDCYCCGCEPDKAVALAIGCKALYDIDRAIDLLVQGSNTAGTGEAELRAAAYGLIVQAASNTLSEGGDAGIERLVEPLTRIVVEGLLVPVIPDDNGNLVTPLFDPAGFDDAEEAQAERERRATVVQSMLCLQRDAEMRWRDLVRNMSSRCRHDLILGSQRERSEPRISQLISRAEALLEQFSGVDLERCRPVDISIPDHLEVSLEGLAYEIPFKGRGRNQRKKR